METLDQVMNPESVQIIHALAEEFTQPVLLMYVLFLFYKLISKKIK